MKLLWTMFGGGSIQPAVGKSGLQNAKSFWLFPLKEDSHVRIQVADAGWRRPLASPTLPRHGCPKYNDRCANCDRCRGPRFLVRRGPAFFVGHMTRAQKIRDFVFGVALIAGAPIVTFFVAMIALQNKSSERFIPPMVLMLAFVGACIWRKKQRVLPGSVFVAEVVAAILASVLFFFMLIFVMGAYAANHSD
jgi:hypothetical protein